MITLALAALLVTASTAAADRVCGRVVSIMCDNGSGPTLDLNLEISKFTDPIRVEVAVPVQDRGPLFEFLGQKICASGRGLRKGSRRVLSVSSVEDLEAPKKLDQPPQLPSGVVRACAPGVVTPPILRTVPPNFPPEVLSGGVQGMVVVEVVVAPDGSVQTVRVARHVERALDEAVSAAAKQWRFGPSERPVALSLEFALSVSLQPGD